MSALGTPLLLGDEGAYQISRSVRLRSSASAYLNRTSGTPTSKDVWTYSGWVKYSTGKYFPLFYALSGGYYEFFEIDNTGKFFWITRNSAGSVFKQYYTAAGQRLFRDPSAWYHFVVRKTSALTLQFYVNGEEFSLTAQTVGSPSSSINTASTAHYIGYEAFSSVYADGYLTEVNFIDGQALTPSSFGETDGATGVWKPKRYAGTYGTNGFYLNFSDNSAATAAAIGKDYSGNGNNWTPNNISVTAGVTYDSMLDTPTPYADGGNGRGNYATLNPVMQVLQAGASAALTNGNLSFSSSAINARALPTIGMSSGKFYWEVTASSTLNSSSTLIRITDVAGAATIFYRASGATLGITGTPTLATYTNGDVIGCAIDIDSSQIAFYKNGAQQGAGFYSCTLPDATSFAGIYLSAASESGHINFGQRPFAYTPPTGFKALNTQNLPDATIKKGNQYFDVTLYTGNGSNQTITNAGFQPDLFWGKSRSAVNNHGIVDSVRGGLSALYSNLTNAETSDGVVTAWNSNGVSLGNSATTNTNGQTYVGWQWKESASAGFDIVTYTGTTAPTVVNHSLGVKPAFIINKIRSAAATGWNVYHKDLGATKYLQLNTTAAVATATSRWNDTEPTSTTVTIGASTGVGDTAVLYLFAEVAGFSKFGSYTGNGSADGPFVYLGFRPKFVMVKRTDTTGTWLMEDTGRNAYNLTDLSLSSESSGAEITQTTAGNPVDILSAGFKCRGTGASSNASGGTYIYAAFAENPFKNSLAR